MATNIAKLIKIANRSEYGWGVGAEYKAYKVTFGGKDEKKIVKAERDAKKKKKD